MSSFVVYRFPNEKAYFLSKETVGKYRFRFQSWDNLSKIYIEGTPQEYSDQLKNLDIDIGNVKIPIIVDKQLYSSQFDKYMQLLSRKKVEKMVLSRVIKHFVGTIDVHLIFMNLCEAYPDVLVYCCSFEKEGIWIGASPELLVRKRGDILESMALAGTKMKAENRSWSPKERREQAIIEEYLYNIVAQSDWLRFISKSKVYTTSMGTIEHLRSDFKWRMRKVYWEKILELLNPTPAVCGMPSVETMQYIKSIESHARVWYTGIVGLEHEDNADMYVNLRCMQLIGRNAYIYVGGGILEESSMQSEWEETEAKANVLRRFL